MLIKIEMLIIYELASGESCMLYLIGNMNLGGQYIAWQFPVSNNHVVTCMDISNRETAVFFFQAGFFHTH